MGTRSAQEINFENEVNNFINQCGGGPITIKFKNSFLGKGLLADVTGVSFSTFGDSSPVDVILTTSSSPYKISCKKDNPINFCGSGLKSFVHEPQMKKWMNKALGECAGRFVAIMEPYKKPIEDFVFNHAQQYGGQAFTAVEKKQLDTLISKYDSVTLPNLYIKLPQGMRRALLTGQGEPDAPITHYLTGEICNPAMMKKNKKTKTLEINDCEIHTIEEMTANTQALYIVLRKRRADQALEIVDKKQPGAPAIKDSLGFLAVYGRSNKNPSEFARRIQIREQKQLPKSLKVNLIEDNEGVVPTRRAPANAQIIEFQWP